MRLVILLDQLADPRNVGAIMRSARAFGVHRCYHHHRNTVEEMARLARAASGALDDLPFIRVVNLARAIKQLQEHDIVVAGLAGDGKDGGRARSHSFRVLASCLEPREAACVA